CCCVQSAGALRELGVAPIMVNSNPETVSTDFDASARLYFDPLDEESIAAVLENEGAPVPVLAQFGGQTALNLADRLAGIGGEIAGTSADAIALAEDRRRFHDFADALGIPQPPGGTASSPTEALAVKGLLNIQFIVENGRVWMLEVNPRASRTVPFLTKVTGVPLVKVAVAIALGSSLAAEGYARADGIWPTGSLVALKAPVFSMAKLLDVDTYLGPEMKSTGEVMGIDRSFAPALWKSLVAAGLAPARSGKILVTVADKDKPEVVPIIE